MTQGKFTKQEGARTLEAVNELFAALPKSKRYNYLNHLNDICLFLEAAQRIAPDEAATENEKE